MRFFNRKSTWTAIRNSLLIVTVIHIIAFLRVFDTEKIALKVVWQALRFQLPRWMAWSLVAPGIWLLAKTFATRRFKWFKAVGWFVLGCAISMSFYYVFEELFKMLFLGRPFFESLSETEKHLLWGWDLPIFALILSISLALEYYQNNRQREVLASRMEKELAVNTLATLKAQIQPHFLFNTLHVISTLVKKDPEASEKMIARLSDLIRSTMKETDTPEVTLTAELDMVMNYVEIIQMRFKDRLRIELDVHPETAEALVPGFFLQPLVENAVRHGIAQSYAGGAVRIKAFKQRQTLVVQIADTGPGFSGKREEILAKGSGLANLQKRLNLLYPGKSRLELLRGDQGGALVVVEIPFRTIPRSPR